MPTPRDTVVAQAVALAFRHPQQPDPLFEGLDLALRAGRVSALVGANGSGKSTLLGLLAGELAPTAGTLVAPAATFVRQGDALEGGGTLLEALLAAEPALAALHASLAAAEAAGLPDPLAYADQVAAFESAGGFAFLHEASALAERAGLGDGALHRPASELSGGQRRLLRIGGAFLRPRELVLLDEPDNHLDERAIERLVALVRGTAAAVLLVSHDRWLIDAVADEVLELERGRLRRYRGGYRAYRDERRAERHWREREQQRLDDEIERLKRAERSYRVWGGRKEAEKSGAFDKGFIGARAARLMKRGIAARDRIVERREELEEKRPWVDKHYRVAFPDAEPPSGTCLTLLDVTVCTPAMAAQGAPAAVPTRPRTAGAPSAVDPAQGRTVLEGVSAGVAWGERVAVLGANGAGKTSLLRVLAGATPAASGRLVWDARARIGYLPQEADSAPSAAAAVGDPRAPEGNAGAPAADAGAPASSTNASTLDAFALHELGEARRLLGALGVRGGLPEGPAGALSAGQRRKVALVRLLLDAPNVLLLDEPTTHLDLPSIEMLEEALEGYRGTLLLVSHDRLLRETLTTRCWRVEGGAVLDEGTCPGHPEPAPRERID